MSLLVDTPTEPAPPVEPPRRSAGCVACGRSRPPWRSSPPSRWSPIGAGPGRPLARPCVSVDGSARVERADGTVERLVGGGATEGPAETTLRQGDGFDLVAGRADLELNGSVRMQARAGTSMVMGRTPDLRAGDLLVTGADPRR